MTVQTHTFDATAVMKAAGLIAASAAVATILDLGPGVGHRVFKVMAEVTAIEIASGDEIYDIVVQGSPDAAFGTAANIVELGAISLGDAATKRTDSDRDDVAGRRSVIVENLNEAGTPLRYVRLYTVVAGTIATGINYSARMVPLDIKA